MNTISGSNMGRQWACTQTEPTRGSEETKLKFYEYKYIRHILMSIMEFMEKNSSYESRQKMPYFVHELDPKQIQTLIDKMTARMKEFEPYISKHTTAHTGYWDI